MNYQHAFPGPPAVSKLGLAPPQHQKCFAVPSVDGLRCRLHMTSHNAAHLDRSSSAETRTDGALIHKQTSAPPVSSPTSYKRLRAALSTNVTRPIRMKFIAQSGKVSKSVNS
jgi:hypothetical protein